MLAALAEVLSSVKIVGSLELVSCLLETLNKVTHTVAPDAADKRYVEQLIMSAVENVVQQFPVGPEATCVRPNLTEIPGSDRCSSRFDPCGYPRRNPPQYVLSHRSMHSTN